MELAVVHVYKWLNKKKITLTKKKCLFYIDGDKLELSGMFYKTWKQVCETIMHEEGSSYRPTFRLTSSFES